MTLRKKILLINPYIAEYRIPIFIGIANRYDLTILHSGKKIERNEINFKQLYNNQIKIGPFYISKLNLHKICNKFDVIISDGNIRYLDRILLVLNQYRKYKWIYWGIGVSASYNKKFDQDTKFDFIRNMIFKRADCNIFYSNYPILKYLQAGFSKDTLFVANNTTAVCYNENLNFEKDSLLFVGTLYKQKRIYELLNAYLYVSKTINDLLPLYIIGNGEEYENIDHWIKVQSLENKIILVGALFEQEKLEKYFRKALACISPGQAGLSVLTSMGYGTPFITKYDAITGGEIFNITNQITGIIYTNDNELSNIIIDISNNKKKYIEMGLEARKFYLENRRPEQMIDSLISGIDYCLKKD